MHDSRLVELLKTLSPTELKELGRWLRSPFANQREEVTRLFDLLADRLGTTREGSLKKETVFKKLFPGEAFDEKRLAYTMSRLNLAAQSWLVFAEQQSGGEAAYRLQLAKALRKRGLEQQSERELRLAEAALLAQPHRNVDFHQLSHQLHLERYESSASRQRTAARSFQEWSDEETIVFAAKKLSQACTALVHKAVSEANLRIDLLEELLAFVEQRQLVAVPAVGIYYLGYKAMTEGDSRAWFGQLREAMRAYSGQFPKAEMRDVTMLAVNCCIRQINTRREVGEQAFWLGQVFEIYKEGLDNQVFIENGVLSRFTYKNIANAGLGLKAFDWVEAFLTQYKDALEPRHREGAYLFNLASLYFRKPDYDRALDLLTRAEFDDVLHNLDARRMLLRIYYDLGEFAALDSLLDSFAIFLRRRKDVGYLRQNYLNLIRFTKKLLQTPANEKEARAKLRKEIDEAKAVAEREWLLGKLGN
ncbi:MAG: hypothetical protein IPN76_05310 [Saprospiraceae bacterium]|nr:hypothetical protein [Saprospiraceae bacterium]